MSSIDCIVLLLVLTCAAFPAAFSSNEGALPERQVTFSAQSHWLDNNDNFSSDGRYLCYDTRETVGPGIEHGQTIEVLEVASGRSIVLYRPDKIITGDAPAPGVGAVSFNLAAPEVSFIHGPPVGEVKERGSYARSNRNGGLVKLGGEVIERQGRFHMLEKGRYAFSWIDKRDMATERDTLPGAHRGGTHRHEFCRDGTRIGFTYDDALLPRYDRTVGYMIPHPQAPAPASHYFAVLVPVVPAGQSRPGDIEKAYGDAWVDPAGTMRAFIGQVRNEEGSASEDALFVVDIPLDVDITTADAGSATRFPSPPEGVHRRRLTHSWAGGIVRGDPTGNRIAYYGKDSRGVSQVFVINALGSDKSDDPSMHPVQITFLEHGAEEGLRWHPDGNAILCVSNNALVMTPVKEDNAAGISRFLTPQGDGIDRHAPVISPDGKHIAYNRTTETYDDDGNILKNYANEDFIQIFMIDLISDEVGL